MPGSVPKIEIEVKSVVFGNQAPALVVDDRHRKWSEQFPRVTKARILQAVREAKGEGAAQLIEHLKKGEMADGAQELLTGGDWLPAPLRTPGHLIAALASPSESHPNPPAKNRRQLRMKRPW
jgi:hypothetical protein